MNARKWKRCFMSSEHEMRAMKRQLEEEMFEMELQDIRSKRNLRLLKIQMKRDLSTIQAQRCIIGRLQKTLKDNEIAEPSGTKIASFKTCIAENDEVCPLSLQPINSSLPPYDPKFADISVEPRKPHHKCAELQCGHRFNALWLLFHFVAQSTFRCPICRSGTVNFPFDLDQLPKGLIDRIKEASNKRIRVKPE